MRHLLPRAAVAVVVGMACGHPLPPSPSPIAAPVPRLLPPAPIDPHARGAAYLTTIAMQLQPGWGQFLDDCRLRLPASHALNRMTLTATARLVIDRGGHLAQLGLESSGNPDFDRAVDDAIRDAAPLAPPPVELLSDDDQLHARWLFARDRRQAGPATAELVQVELPLGGVIERRIAEADLSRAARRIAAAPPSTAATAATERVMVAALREALDSADGAVRRAAVDAIARARVAELAPEIRTLLSVTSDTELRLTAMAAVAVLSDREAAAVLVRQFPGDLPEHPRLALAEARAIAALGGSAELATALGPALDSTMPSATAIEALAFVPLGDMAPKLATWARRGDARARAAVCNAAIVVGGSDPWDAIDRGLRDADATVRARCAEAAIALGDTAPERERSRKPAPARAVSRLHELVRDRDRAVRARAIAALVALDPSHAVRGAEDSAAEVRAAYATALARAPAQLAEYDLHTMIDDRDPDVRAAAWTSLVIASATPGTLGSIGPLGPLAVRAATDAAPQVRHAAIPAIDNDDVLARLAAGDDAPESRTTALVELAGRRGRAAMSDPLLERMAVATKGSADRVRTALAWLLAR